MKYMCISVYVRYKAFYTMFFKVCLLFSVVFIFKYKLKIFIKVCYLFKFFLYNFCFKMYCLKYLGIRIKCNFCSSPLLIKDTPLSV